MRVGVVGFGYWGINITRNFVSSPGISSVTVCDRDSVRLDKAKRMFPSVKVTADMNQVLKSPEIDIVAVVTPVSSHFEIAKLALENGKHVLVEKPMTFSSKEAEILIRLAKQKNLVLGVDHTFIHTPAVKKLKELIDSRALGDLWYFDSVRINLGLYQHDVNVIWDLAAHDLAILLYLTGQRPLAVSAHGSAHAGNGMADIAYITLKYENNFIAHFHVNWLAPTKIRQVIIGASEKMAVWDDMSASEKIKVYDKGIIVPDQAQAKSEALDKVLIKYRTGDVYSPNLDNTEALSALITNFLNCIHGKEELQAPAIQGLNVVAILETAQRSLQDAGRMVNIEYPQL